MSYPLLGRAGAYNWRTGLCLAIPIYSLLFGWWHAFFTKKSQRWTYVFPWLLLMVLFYLHVAHERDWAFQIIMVDEYLLAGWSAPVIGIILHVLCKRTKWDHFWLIGNSPWENCWLTEDLADPIYEKGQVSDAIELCSEGFEPFGILRLFYTLW